MRKGCTLLALALAVLLAGCMVAPKPTAFSNSRIYDNDFDAVWTALIEAFADNSWPISYIEKDFGIITTDWLPVPLPERQRPWAEGPESADCGMDEMGDHWIGPGTMAFNVSAKKVAAGTELRVTITFQSVRGGQCLSKGIIEARIMDAVAKRLSAE